MPLPHQPDISTYDDALKLLVIAGYPKRVLDAIALNKADAAFIAHTERAKLEDVFTGTAGLEGFLDTEAGTPQTNAILTELKGITIDPAASPFVDPEKDEVKKVFEKLARHVREAIVNLATKIAPIPPAPGPSFSTTPPNIPRLKQDLDDEENRRQTAVITVPALLATLSATLEALKFDSRNDPDLVSRADELFKREELKHNECLRIKAMTARHSIQVAIDAIQNKTTGKDLDKLPDPDRNALVQEAERAKASIPPLLKHTDFITFLGITPDQHDPVTEATRKFVDDYLLSHPGYDFNELRNFLKDPASLTASLVKAQEDLLEAIDDEIAQKDRKIKALERRFDALKTPPKSGVGSAPADLNIILKGIEVEIDKTEKEKRDEMKKKKPIIDKRDKLKKIDLGDKRKLNRRGQLDMIHLYFEAKQALATGDDIDRDKINEDSNKAIKAADQAQRKAIIDTDPEVLALRPDLLTSLKAVAKEDGHLKDIPLDHIIQLPDIATNPKKLAAWIDELPPGKAKKVGLAQADLDKIDDKNKELVLPTLVGYFRAMMNTKGRAQINKESLTQASQLIDALEDVQLTHAIEKGKKKTGSLIDQMLTVSDTRNAGDATAMGVEQDLILKNTSMQETTNAGKRVLKTLGLTAFATTTAVLSPLVATLGVGAAFAGFYAMRSRFSKDKLIKKESKSSAIKTAVVSALGGGGMALGGLTMWSVLPLAAAGMGLKYVYKKNKGAIKRTWGKFLNAATAGLFQDTDYVNNLITTA